MSERQAMILLFAASRAQARWRNDKSLPVEVTDQDMKEAADDVALMETILGAKP